MTVVPWTSLCMTSELAPLVHALVHVGGRDQLGAGVNERAENARAVRDCPLRRPPTRAAEVALT
jgi:hypothetical protein